MHLKLIFYRMEDFLNDKEHIVKEYELKHKFNECESLYYYYQYIDEQE